MKPENENCLKVGKHYNPNESVLPEMSRKFSIFLLILSVVVLAFSSLFRVYHRLKGNLEHSMRMRVRPYMYVDLPGQLGLIALCVFGPGAELIGLQYFPCFINTMGIVFGASIIFGAITRRILIYVWKAKLSRLKDKITIYTPVKEIKRARRLIRRQLGRYLMFYFGAMFFVVLIPLIAFHWPLYVGNGCVNCEALDPTSALFMWFVTLFYFSSNIYFLLKNREEADAYAQFPEYRLLLIFVNSLPFAAGMFLYFDPNQLNSKFIFRGNWILLVSAINYVIISGPYQVYLAITEDNYLKVDGGDCVSVVWAFIRKRKNRIAAAVDKDNNNNNMPPPPTPRDRIASIERTASLNISRFLVDPQNARLFSEYLSAEYCSELLMFHSRVEEFEDNFDTQSEDERIKMAKAICVQYIEDGSPLQVNIGHALRDKILESCAGEHPTIIPQQFQAAKREVLKMLNDGPFARFIKLHPYLDDSHSGQVSTKMKSVSSAAP